MSLPPKRENHHHVSLRARQAATFALAFGYYPRASFVPLPNSYLHGPHA